MNLLKKLFISFSFPYYWMKIKEHMRNSNYIEALEYFDKIGNNLPKYKYKFYFFKAFTMLMLKKYCVSIDLIKKGLNSIDSITKYNDDEKNYLKVYGLELLQMNFKMIDKVYEVNQLERQISIISFNINNIRNNILNNFPMRDNIQWNKLNKRL